MKCSVRKYFVAPFVLFVFGVFLFWVETAVLSRVGYVSIEIRVLLNQINTVLFILLPLLLFVLLVQKRSKETPMKYQIFYIVYYIIGLSYIGYYWVTYLQWR